MINILVVEDNQINQKILSAFLRKFKMDFSIVGNAAEALRKIEDEPFDCILMDITLPDFDGIETSEKIRRKENMLGIYTPIVAVTASVQAGDKERILASGIDYYIPKPVNEQNLFEVLFKIYGCKIAKESAEKKSGSITNNQNTNMQENIINKLYFDDNFQYFDKETVLEIIDLYLTEYPERIIKLEKHIAETDLKSLRETAHSLKGVISYFGAPTLLDLIRKIEEDSRNGIFENIPSLFEEFVKLGSRMIEELNVLRRDFV